jgi:hypothetical protein
MLAWVVLSAVLSVALAGPVAGLAIGAAGLVVWIAGEFAGERIGVERRQLPPSVADLARPCRNRQCTSCHGRSYP